MSDADTVGLPLEVDAGAASNGATEAFGLLANETRLAILLALWEEYDPHSDDNAISFTELFERVDYDTPGNFNYHLSQLEGQFIRKRAEREGYELRVPGLKIVQTVIGGAGVQDATLERTEIDQDCPFCGSSTAISYRDGLLFQSCTDCEGAAPERTNVDGFLNAVKFKPAGLVERSPEHLRAASRVAKLRHTQTMFEGVCPTCSGSVDGWLDCCPNHDSKGVCENCGARFAALARLECRVCKEHTKTSPKALVLFHQAVIGFYDDHGVSTQFRGDDFESVQRGFKLMDSHELDIVSENPPRVVVTVESDGDELRLTFDETVAVVDVER